MGNNIFGDAVVDATLLLLLACCLSGVQCQESPEVRASLVSFLHELAGGDEQVARDLMWDASVDPCGRGGGAAWTNVTCDPKDGRVRAVSLEGHGARLNGPINATLLCAAAAIHRVSLQGNALRGGVPADIASCKGISHLYLSGNRLSGHLPPSLAQLRRLLVVDVSRNDFSGEIPRGLSELGLVRFLANDNHFNGTIPDCDLTGFRQFNVSNNNLTGPIPKNTGTFRVDSFWPNAAGICGQPVFAPCQPSPSPSPQTGASPPGTDSGYKAGKGRSMRTKIVTYLGYVLLGAVILAFAMYLCFKKRRRNKLGDGGSGRRVYDSSKVTTTTSVSASKSVYSLPTTVQQSTAETGTAVPSASLVVLQRSGTASVTSAAAAAAAKELRFEDLLKSPAEMLGRGRFGSSYKVVVPGGAALAVKRVKDAAVSEEFRRRMERVGRAKHPAVLPPLAFYCHMQEKLVVYEFQSNGSLAKLLHGSIESSQGPVDWATRLHIAAKVADGMAFMHGALRGHGTSTFYSSSGEEAAAADGPIAHGNLKTSNILFTAGMDPCVSEYGVTAPLLPKFNDGVGARGSAALQADVRAFGVVLLELLTGKATVARGDGAELARWVSAVIREEWTAEVFDRDLLAAGDGSSEQRMVRLLQVAMRCVDGSPGAAPPTMREVASMINAIREEGDRSLSSEA